MKCKTENIIIRIEPELKAKAQAQAEKQGDTLSRYITKLIEEDTRRKGIKIYTADRETGTFIEECDTIAEAIKKIAEYEETDKADGTYGEGFYDIVDQDHMSIV